MKLAPLAPSSLSNESSLAAQQHHQHLQQLQLRRQLARGQDANGESGEFSLALPQNNLPSSSLQGEMFNLLSAGSLRSSSSLGAGRGTEGYSSHDSSVAFSDLPTPLQPQQQPIGSGRAPGRQLHFSPTERPFSVVGMVPSSTTTALMTEEPRGRSGAMSAPMFSETSTGVISPTLFTEHHIDYRSTRTQAFQPLHGTAELTE